MKRAIFISLFAGTLVLASGNLTGQSSEKETRKVSGFTEISFGIAGSLYVNTGPEFSVALEGDKKYLADIETVVRNGKLIIRMENNRFFSNFNNEKANVYITLPELNGLGVSGSGTAQVESSIKSKTLYLDVSGSGKIIVPEVVSGELNCDISGSGNISVRGNGEIDKGEISISGSGNYSGESAGFKNLHINISGSGHCDCKVTESLNASVSGSGNVNYSGNPKIDARVSGSGHVRSR